MSRKKKYRIKIRFRRVCAWLVKKYYWHKWVYGGQQRPGKKNENELHGGQSNE